MELGICFPKRNLVGEQHPRSPGARGGDTRDHAEHAEHQPEQKPPVRVDSHPVGVPALARGGHRAVDGPQPVGQRDVRPDNHGHEQPGHEEHGPARAVGGGEHGRVVDGPVPQEIRPDPGHDRDQHQEGDHGHDDRKDQPGPAQQDGRRTAGRRPGRSGPEGHRTPPHMPSAQYWAVRRQCTPIRPAKRHSRRRGDHAEITRRSGDGQVALSNQRGSAAAHAQRPATFSRRTHLAARAQTAAGRTQPPGTFSRRGHSSAGHIQQPGTLRPALIAVRSSMAWRSVATLARRSPAGTAPVVSEQLAAGVRKIVAPAARAPAIFC